jgi:hypothetical protein
VAVADGRITESRFASWRKLQAEAARLERDGGPRAKAEARRSLRTANRARRTQERRDERVDP